MMTHANDVKQIMRDIPSPYLVVVALYGTQGHLKQPAFAKLHRFVSAVSFRRVEYLKGL